MGNVHRLVLCACSQYFEDVLTFHKEKQPIIFLNRVEFSIIEAIIEYMYKGEVNLNQNQLPNFLATAKFLKIKGLADNDSQTPKVDTCSPVNNIHNQTSKNESIKIDKIYDSSFLTTALDSNLDNKNVLSSDVRMAREALNDKPTTTRKSLSEPTNVNMISNQNEINFSSNEFNSSLEEVPIEDNFVSVSMETAQDTDYDQQPFKLHANTFQSESIFSETQATVPRVNQLNDPPQLPSPYVVQNINLSDIKPCKIDSPPRPKKRKSTSLKVTTSSKEALRSKTDTCKFCWRRFYNCPNMFRTHMKECDMLPQSMRPPFSCPHCPYQCQKEYNLKRHLNSKHKS